MFYHLASWLADMVYVATCVIYSIHSLIIQNRNYHVHKHKVNILLKL